MRAVGWYGVAAALVVAVLAGLVWLAGVGSSGVWVAAGLAWVVQLIAFSVLVVGRKGTGFMLSWAAGMALRFGVVLGAALWVTRTGIHDPTELLLGLVGFVFVLVLLEPLFLRLAD